MTAAVLALAACGGDDDPIDDGEDVEAPEEDEAADQDDADLDQDDADDADPDEDLADDGDDSADGEGGDEQAADPEADGDADDPAPLDAEASTDDREEDSGPPAVSVVDVRAASHDGFDRVVFEIAGDGQAGWGTLYQDQALTQGQGEQVDLAGDAVLEIGLRGIALPTDPPEGVEPYDGPERIDVGGTAVLEVYDDSVFEGQHVFFLGLESEAPYRIQRLDDPQRVVVDVVTDGS